MTEDISNVNVPGNAGWAGETAVTPPEFEPGEIVRHFKRGLLPVEELKSEPAKYLYQIIGVAENTETGENMMIYRAIYGDKKTYARPLDIFYSKVDTEEYPESTQVYRFEKYPLDDMEAG